MYPSVQSVWTTTTRRLEGLCYWLYLDSLGYITTGLGDLCDPIDMARALPWVRHDGMPASDDDVTTAWRTVDALRSDPKGQKQTSGPATKYGQAFAGYTSIRLTDDGVAQTMLRQVAANETQLRRYFANYDTMPADGQMAINSMAWAMGSGFPVSFQHFTAAVNSEDWETAKAESPFRGSGVQHRIDMDTALLENAARVAAQGLDPSTLYYPAAA
jgi:GH24 family phage-related lysozyme (muramidase)